MWCKNSFIILGVKHESDSIASKPGEQPFYRQKGQNTRILKKRNITTLSTAKMTSTGCF